MSLHSSATGLDLHEDKRIKQPARASATANVTLAAPGATIDGVTLASGNRILLTEQSVLTENGIYVWSGAASPLARSSDADSDSDFPLGFLTFVSEGTARGQTLWMFTTVTAVTVGSTSLTFETITATGPTGPTGATGATGPSGSAGATGLSTITLTGAPLYACIQDQKAQNTAGGNFASGADQTRTLNTIVSDDNGLVTLATNRFTLAAGTYRIRADVPAYSVNQHQAMLYNFTDSATVQRGTSSFSAAGTTVQAFSVITCRISIASAKAFEIRHRCLNTNATNGFGVAANFGTEVYTSVEIWLEGGPAIPPGKPLLDMPNLDKLGQRRFQSAVDEVGQSSNAMLPFVVIGTTTSITNVTGTTAVYTFASPPAVTTGQAVSVTGATPSVYNVSAALVTNVAGNTFSVDIGSSGNGAASVQGTAVLL